MWAFLLLPLIVLMLQATGRRFFPVLMPEGRMRPFLWGLAGGLAGHFGFHVPGLASWAELGSVNLLGAALGAAALLLLAGLFPFLKIFLGSGS